jgi:hypothetical protein
MRFPSYGVAGVLTMCLLAAPALAESAGKISVSGKQGVTCSNCHVGGQVPTVELSGPTTLAAGETGQYSLIIRGGAAVKGGMNVAVSNTTASLEPGAGVSKKGAELTHASGGKAFSNGEVRFDFSMVAPSTAGTLTLYGAGNSTNGNGLEDGDMSAAKTWSVTITSPTGGTDGGTGGPDAGTNPGTNPGEGDDKGGCSATGGAPVLLFSLLAAGMTVLRRRRD